jgi:hypothetical protein
MAGIIVEQVFFRQVTEKALKSHSVIPYKWRKEII